MPTLTPNEVETMQAQVRSLVIDDRRAIVFVQAKNEVPESFALGLALKSHLKERFDKTADAVYWKFRG